MERVSAGGHFQQIETSSFRDTDVSKAVPHTGTTRGTMSSAWRPLLESPDYVSLPGVAGPSRNAQPELGWLHQADASRLHSPSLHHSKVASFNTGINKNIVFVYNEIHGMK